MARKFFVCGNWKCNGTSDEVKNIVATLNAAQVASSDVVVSPPFVFLPTVKESLQSDFQIAAQNCWVQKGGDFTGEVSAEMLVDLGIPWVIIGHSERRALLNESNEFVGEKIAYALSQGLKVIACVGETLEQREYGNTMDVIVAQTKAIADRISRWDDVVLAYEPVWAIGTAEVATVAQAQDVNINLRNWLEKNVSSEVAITTRIIFGGPVTTASCKQLAAQPDVDGFLVGGASLFIDIIEALEIKKRSLLDLPNELLYKILTSGLTAKDVLCTGSVSRKWHYLISSIPDLVLDLSKFQSPPGEDEVTKLRRFVSFVETLLFRQPNIGLQKFLLTCKFDNSYLEHMESWIKHAISLNATILGLHSICPNGQVAYQLFFDILKNSAVVDLRLIGCTLTLPSHMEKLVYTSIQSVNLGRMVINAGAVESISEGCTNLKTLTILGCRGMVNMVISSQSLITIAISDYELHGNPQGMLEINCPNLNDMELRNVLVPRFVLNSSEKLYAAVVFFSKSPEAFIFWSRITETLGHVQRLSLQNWGNATSEIFRPAQVANFSSVVYLHLITKFSVSDMHGIASILANMPAVKTLHLARDLNVDDLDNMPVQSGDYMNVAFNIPSLRVLIVDGFRGDLDEYCFLRLMVKAGVPKIIVHQKSYPRVVLVKRGIRYVVAEGSFLFLAFICQ